MYNPTITLLKLLPRRIYKGKEKVHPTTGHDGRHTAHYQELKTVLAVSGFAYVKGFGH